jgi:hydrogenase maturation protease
MRSKNNKVLIIGIGNEFRDDDGAGIICARKIKERVNSNASVIENNGDGAILIESWEGFDNVILVDSISSGAIHKFDGIKDEFPNENTIHSSHLFSVADAIKTSKILNKLPGNLVIYGIEGKSYKLGSKISSEVNKAIEKLVKVIEKEL